MNNGRSSWFDELRASAPDILDVAQALGLQVRGTRFGPCPSCGRDSPRHHPITRQAGGAGWMCAGCKTTGDVVRLACIVLTGSPKGDWGPVRAFFAAHGWCSAEGDVPYAPRPAPKRVAAELPYPDRREVLAVLGACRPAAAVAELHSWYASRGWNRRLPAGVLPDVYPWPEWWQGLRGWKLVVPMVDTAGAIVSLHGRWPAIDSPHGKTRWPKGRRAGGLLFADPWRARPLLRGVNRGVERVLVVEGVTSYLSACCHMPPDVAVLGADNGGFPALARLPFSLPTWIATDCGDPDGTGDRYWREAKRAVPHAQRVLLPGRMDVADLLHPAVGCTFQDLFEMTEPSTRMDDHARRCA